MYNTRVKWITLSSAGNKLLQRSNTASSFTIQLPHTVSLPPVSTYYEIGITNLILPARFYNVTNTSNKIIIKKSKTSRKSNVPDSYSIDSYDLPQLVQIPHLLDHISHNQFVKHVNVNVPALYTTDFEMQYVKTDASAKLHFLIKNQAIVTFSESDRAFWEALGVPSGKIGQNLTNSFSVKANATDDEILRIPYPLNITIKKLKKETFQVKNLPEVNLDDEFTVISLHPGIYEKEKSLIDHITQEIDKYIIEKASDGKQKKVFDFSLNIDHTLTLKVLNDQYMIKFPDELALKLGFPQDKWLKDQEKKAAYPVDLFYGNSTFYIYSDLAVPSINSDTVSPLLRVVPAEFSFKGGRVKGYPMNPIIYMPLAKTTFNNVSIYIVDDFGKPIQFLPHVQTTLKLHIRVYKE
jgi:hypothetical protein